MRGLPWLLSFMALLGSPCIVVLVWLWVFKAVSRRDMAASVAAGLAAATLAACVHAVGFVRLGAWVFNAPP